ncbi:MAG: hydrogenase, partial [Pirellulales bacterium]|nr:hydrogenase [Pirellulales bacterium]
MSLAIANGLDNTVERPGERAPLVLGDTTYHHITEAVCQVAERKPNASWWAGFIVSFILLNVLG